MKNNEKFVKLAREEIKNNSLYLWGGQGESVEKTTPEKIQKMETSQGNAARILKLLSAKLTAGCNMKKAKYFDCSGLVVDLLQRMELIKDDYTADGIYKELCEPVKLSDLKKGDLCFIDQNGKKVHVGIWDKEYNQVIEAAGRDLGVVGRGMNKNKWNAFGRLKCL